MTSRTADLERDRGNTDGRGEKTWLGDRIVREGVGRRKCYIGFCTPTCTIIDSKKKKKKIDNFKAKGTKTGHKPKLTHRDIDLTFRML